MALGLGPRQRTGREARGRACPVPGVVACYRLHSDWRYVTRIFCSPYLGFIRFSGTSFVSRCKRRNAFMTQSPSVGLSGVRVLHPATVSNQEEIGCDLACWVEFAQGSRTGKLPMISLGLRHGMAFLHRTGIRYRHQPLTLLRGWRVRVSSDASLNATRDSAPLRAMQWTL